MGLFTAAAGQCLKGESLMSLEGKQGQRICVHKGQCWKGAQKIGRFIECPSGASAVRGQEPPSQVGGDPGCHCKGSSPRGYTPFGDRVQISQKTLMAKTIL